jgi:hypothetical protein
MLIQFLMLLGADTLSLSVVLLVDCIQPVASNSACFRILYKTASNI